MKKSLLLFSIISALVFAACDNPTSSSDDNTISIIPIVGFGSVASGRISVSDTTANERSYACFAPILTSFSTVSDYTEDSTYAIPLFDTYVDFSITVNDDSTITYTGTLRDGSGSISVDYNSDTETFSFEQIIIVTGTIPDESTTFDLKAAVYAKGTDISITSEGYFQGLYDISFMQEIDGERGLASKTAELYRGVLNSNGQIGTGIAMCGDTDTDATDGYRSVELEDFTGITLPAEISNSTMSSWKDYLSSNDVLGSDDGGAEYSWTLYYKIDDASSIVGLSDTSSNDPFTAFSDGFTQSDDLSSWRDKSLLLN